MSGVKYITVQGYKSIELLNHFELTNLNVLIGANGSGKSNFISLFRMLHEMYEQRFQLYVQKQGGPDALLHFGRKQTEKITIDFGFGESRYHFSLVPTNDNRLVLESEQINGINREFAAGGNPEPLIREIQEQYQSGWQNAIGAWRVYHFHDTGETAKVKQMHASNDNLRLKSDASNLAAYLYKLKKSAPESYGEILQTIRMVLPFFHDFVFREGPPEYVELEWFQKGHLDTPLKAHVLSDGSLRFICLMTLLLQPVGDIPGTVIIDEPELGLHPMAINILADVLKKVSHYRQVIVSTQSVELLNQFEPADVVVVDQEDGASSFSRLDAESLKEWLESYSLGELWNKNILGGRPA